MTVTKDIIDKAQQSRTKILQYLESEEKQLYNFIIQEIEAKIEELTRGMVNGQMNPVRVKQLITELVKSTCGVTYFASATARDILESNENPLVNKLTKLSYETVADKLTKVDPTNDSQNTDEVDSAIAKLRNKDEPKGSK